MCKVLIVERSPVIMDSLVTSLQNKYEVHTCSSNEDAMEHLIALRPDGLIIDLADALSVLKNVRYRPPAVLALTDYISSDILHNAGSAGVDAVFVIPFSVEAITDRLNKLLGCLSI